MASSVSKENPVCQPCGLVDVQSVQWSLHVQSVQWTLHYLPTWARKFFRKYFEEIQIMEELYTRDELSGGW